jgi:hypothetical protein
LTDLGVYRALDGRVEPWDPRAHPAPWSRRLTPRERRRRARTGLRGRRGARRVDLHERVSADELQKVYLLRGPPPPPRVFRGERILDAPTMLRRHEFILFMRGDDGCTCSWSCVRDGWHVEEYRLTLYCEGDPTDHEAAVNDLFANLIP